MRFKRNPQAWQKFGDTAEDALYRMISGTDDWRSSLASLLPTLKELVLQLASLSNNKNSLGGLLGSYFTGGMGENSSLMSRYGGIARLFANGSAFINSIVDRPTPFRFAD